MYKTNVLKSIKKATSFILVLVMLAGLLPLGALSFGAQAAAADNYMRIYHVDCGRKYFSATVWSEVSRKFWPFLGFLRFLENRAKSGVPGPLTPS